MISDLQSFAVYNRHSTPSKHSVKCHHQLLTLILSYFCVGPALSSPMTLFMDMMRLLSMDENGQLTLIE